MCSEGKESFGSQWLFLFLSQWECKTDLDIAYKFGKTVVSCEGYESSEDQYILRGSCGLEYNLDYTELGLRKLKESGKHQSFFDYYHKLSSVDSCGLVTVAVLFVLAFVVYKLFLSDGQGSPPPYSEHPPYSQHSQRFAGTAGAPPPGFKSDFTGMCLCSGAYMGTCEQASLVPGFEEEAYCLGNTMLLTYWSKTICSFFKKD